MKATWFKKRMGAAMSALMPAPVKRGLRVKNIIRRITLMAGICLVFGWMVAPATGADGVDPEADKILRSMSAYLGGLPAFSMDVDIDSEIVDLEGQKLQMTSSASITAERPGKLYVHRRGAFADVEFFFNGKVLSIYGKGLNVYTEIDSPGSIDEAIDTVRNEVGLDAPGADLLYADPYPGLIDGVMSSTYLGTTYVNGIECHYLAFREARVDWQLWVQTGDTPFPMKYVITTKWMTGAPQYSLRFRNWNAAPAIDAGTFEFKAPDGAKKIESVQANETGELMIMEEVQ